MKKKSNRMALMAITVIAFFASLTLSINGNNKSKWGVSSSKASEGGDEAPVSEWFATLDVPQACNEVVQQFGNYYRQRTGAGSAWGSWAPYSGSVGGSGGGTETETYSGPMMVFIAKSRTPCKTAVSQCNQIACHPTGLITYNKP